MPDHRPHGLRAATLGRPVSRTPVRVLAVLVTALAAMAILPRIIDVPSTDVVYRAVVEVVASLPAWLHTVIEAVSELGLIALAGGLLLTGWRARSRGSDVMARVLTGGLGAAAAYVTSETAKAVLAQERPCRSLPEVTALLTCPGPGDWALPSNHATIAGAVATAVVLAAPRAWPAVTAMAALVAASRVALGVHYPHDVITGLILGAAAVTFTVVALHAPARRLVDNGRAAPWIAPLLGASSRRNRITGARDGA